MFFFLLLCICFLIVVLYVGKTKYKSKEYWIKRNVIQMDDVLEKFMLGNVSLAEIYKEIYDAHPTEPYVGIFRGNKPALLLRDLNNIRQVLSGDFENFHQRGSLINPNDKLADNVLFIDDLARWKLIRHKISPVFTTLRLKCMFDVIEKCAQDLLQLMEDNTQIKDSPFSGLYIYTTASIGASIFGIDTIRTRNAMESPFLKMSLQATGPSFRNNIAYSICYTFPWLFKLLRMTFFGEYENFFIGAIKKVINARKEDPIKRFDLIDLFINLLSQGVVHDVSSNYEIVVTEELLAAQAFFFFIAGADTTANTMHFTLLELANNPHILQKTHEEIDKVFMDGEEGVSFEDVDKLKYLDMVINETLRKYPTIGLIQRKCTKDTVLQAGNLKIEKDVVVIVPVFAVHRDENYFPNSEKFDPDRFKNENLKKLNNYSYLPFGEGNRMCMGIRFARMQVKIGLAWLLRSFSLREQSEKLNSFEKSFFAVRAPNAYYELTKRDVRAKKNPL